MPSGTKATHQLLTGLSILGESLQLPTKFAHLHNICIQVTAPGVSMPPSIPFCLGVSGEKLNCCYGCRFAKVVAYPPPTSLKNVVFNWLLFCFSL
ncbi:hypothetical protein DPMN_173473 [Dreissena polymorpha]|uniref:Uncharacterized protein n=1 Tax=Dreissena polymorpha TaxID=45954 RepID=A0A9D4E3I0_DREPO|nr:hypothetical protein DPMN_173473 [Dreissena polymorpha]